MKAINLKTAFMAQPRGIDIPKPRLSWNCLNGSRQTAYQVECRSPRGEVLWDSGKVEDGSMYTSYAGHSLRSRETVRWRVRVWDGDAPQTPPGPWSEDASFETGLLEARDWQARWISGDYRPRKGARYPVDCFRKTFDTTARVVWARLYATACGVYQATLNGKTVEGFVLAPGITDYRVRVQYQVYDVTSLVQEGANTLEVMLADGWYRGSVGAWGHRCQYGTQTKLLAQLELEYDDGSRRVVATDGTWEWCDDGPLRSADNKDGEVVDASMAPSYTGRALVTSHPVVPSASNNVPVVEAERFQASVVTTPSGMTVLDFGQNIAGYLEFCVNAHKGQRVSLRFGELLDARGEFTQDNIQLSHKDRVTPLQRVDYLCAEGLNRYKTRFAVFGFRYVLLETDACFDPRDFQAVAVRSDLPQTGWFDCSDPLLNQFVHATLWSAKGNTLDLPTDCPTRERHGWSGDAQLFCETASYLFDCMPFARKYLHDLYDWQKPSGLLPQIAPYGGVDFYMYVMNGSAGWSDAGILIPYRLWKMYGDRSVLQEFYDGMSAYAHYMVRRCGRWGGLFAKGVKVPHDLRKYVVNCGQIYGEWAEPADVHAMRWTDFVTPKPEVSTAYTAYVLRIMAEVSDELGRSQDAVLFREYADGCTRAYQAMAKTPAFTLDTDRQARLVRPLAMGLLDDRQREYAQKRLTEALEHYGWRLGTGFLSTPLILKVLAEYDLDAAYRLLENQEMPGWLFMAKNGATTVWESWEGTLAQDGIASVNHYSKGAVCSWLFSHMCGIAVAAENRFELRPLPGGSFTWAKARFDSVYGTVESGWRKDGGDTVFELAVPANTTALALLPGCEPRELDAGSYCATLHEDGTVDWEDVL